ncbi:serine hydrolase domain-containing protein [Ectobacillus ponti]|uniref:Beta-lactamase family protein n=1 Tax=Ectobacillus ponti TaxID=2961894 RepID=A0AA42BRY2_9BACI|nr:serine hydrolase domain-containing protein [Ectobacillus ponti]MCP8970811.1 beta-lactamase family protein [Ectobacillus ponti]
MRIRKMIILACLVAAALGVKYYEHLQDPHVPLGTGPGGGISSGGIPTGNKADEKLAVRLDEYMRQQGFNGTLLVQRQGRTVISKGYGYADAHEKRLNTPDTKFIIGSITKSFIAASILQLAEQGKLHIDDNVHHYIPSFPESKGITLRNLLQHTSGLPNRRYEHGREAVNAEDHAKLVQWIGKQKLQFQPGTGWMYSDRNYMVLGYVVERVSGQHAEDYVREHMIRKAGLQHTAIGRPAQADPMLSTGYKSENGKWQVDAGLNWPWLYSCGNVYMTAGDLVRFDQALMDGTLVSTESARLMLIPSAVKNYGMSFYQTDLCEFNHGVISGWDVYNNFNLRDHTFVIVMSNAVDYLPKDFNKTVQKMVWGQDGGENL